MMPSNAVITLAERDTKFEKCRHGVECNSELECILACSHWTHRQLNPVDVIDDYMRSMANAYQQNQRDFNRIAQINDVDVTTRNHLPDQSYAADDANAKFDLWGVENCNANCSSLIILIHGGYWQEGSRKYFTSFVRPLVDNGAVVAVIGYDLADGKSGVTLTNITSQVAQAIKYFDDNCTKRFGCSSVSIIGHSAGAQLAAMALINNRKLKNVKNIYFLSPAFDTETVAMSSINDAIRMTQQEAAQNSPLRHCDELIELSQQSNIRLHFICASHDSPIFHRILAHFNSRFGDRITSKIIDNQDHFTLVQQLSDYNYELCRYIIDHQ